MPTISHNGRCETITTVHGQLTRQILPGQTDDLFGA
jgi:hypothetical protein